MLVISSLVVLRPESAIYNISTVWNSAGIFCMTVCKNQCFRLFHLHLRCSPVIKVQKCYISIYSIEVYLLGYIIHIFLHLHLLLSSERSVLYYHCNLIFFSISASLIRSNAFWPEFYLAWYQNCNLVGDFGVVSIKYIYIYRYNLCSSLYFQSFSN